VQFAQRAAEHHTAQGDGLGVRPVGLALEPVVIAVAGKEVQAGASARLYDFGAITIALQAPIIDEPWGTFVRNVNAVDRGFQAEETWDRLLRQLRDLLGQR
jgi:hypothetical protein